MKTPMEIPTRGEMAMSRTDSPTKVFRLASGISTAAFAIRSGITVERVEAIEAGGTASTDENWRIGLTLDIPTEMLEAPR